MAIERIAAGRLILAILIASVPAALLLGLVGEALAGNFTIAGLVRLTLFSASFGVPMAAVTGVPLALWRLRDPAASVSRWAVTGLAAGALGGLAIFLWAMVNGHEGLVSPGLLLLLILAIACTGSTLTALIARRLLSVAPPR